MTRRLVRAALAGATPSGLERLLADVLDESGLRLEVVATPEEAEIVFALVRREDVVATICGLRSRAQRILAILAVRDDRVAQRALDAGAHACYALDAPVERLRFVVLTLLLDPKRPKPPLFRLGARTREVLQELRVFSARQGEALYRIHGDAEQRLELAIRADFSRYLPRPFGLGVNGRRETTLMRLDPLAVERLERAIEADIEQGLGRRA